MTARALIALVEARLYVARRQVLFACGCAVLLGLAQPNSLAAPLFFCSFVGIAMALDQTPGRHFHLDRCEQAAPLFGRELARAKALVPCVAAVLATLLFACAQLARGSPDASLTLLAVAPAAVACALTALSASIRLGWSRALYVALASATSGIAYALAVIASSIAAEVAFCAIVAFLALRQYGETLARFDPV